MAEPASTPERRATRSFAGLIFISIGVLWLTLTGLCTLAAFVTLMGQGDLSDIMLILAFAVPSALIGGGIYFIGRLLRPAS